MYFLRIMYIISYRKIQWTMKGTNSMFDIIIIGSGPAGLSAAIYAKRANLNVAVAEKNTRGQAR